MEKVVDNLSQFKAVLEKNGSKFSKITPEQHVRIQQLTVLYKQGMLAYVGTAAACIVIISLLWDVVAHYILLGWGAAIVLNICLAITWAVAFKRYHIFPKHTKNLDWSFTIQAVFHGSTWGALGLLALNVNDDQLLMGAIITLVGMATGSITTTAAVYRSFLAYMLPTILPISLGLVFHKDAQAWNLVGILLTLYTLVIAVAGFEFFRSLRDSFQLRNRNEDLVETLVSEKHKTDGIVKMLEKEIVERENAEEQLRHAKQSAEDANNAKSRFLANMSHEIRTPLASIIGFSELLLEEQDPDERRQSTKTIINNGKHLLEVINDILDLSKIESEKLEIENIEVPIVDTLSEIMSTFGRLVRDKDIEFSLDYSFPVPGVIHSDPTRIRQIVFNLISNAMKFTDKGKISVGVSFDQRQKTMAIKVKDSGIGMSDEQQSRLFQPFSQADVSTTRKYGGTGLGLTISRRLAKMLGGELVCESTVGEGSTFTLTLATGEVDEENLFLDHGNLPISKLTQLQDIPSLAGKILVAEDSPDIQRLVSMLLKRTGVDFTIVENGKLAVEKALAEEFDLILTDMQMPEMDGIEATNLLRSLNVETPIVAMTANLLSDDKKIYDEIGMNGYIGKPIDQNDFYQTISEYFNSESNCKDVAGYDSEYQGLLEQFKQRASSMMDEMREYIKNGNFKELAAVSHTLKGLGGSFGFQEVTDIAHTLEQAAKCDDQVLSRETYSILNNYVKANVLID